MNNKTLKFIFCLSILILTVSTGFAQSQERNQKVSELSKKINFKDTFKPLELGSVPLPPSKEMAYPSPDGYAKLKVDFPDEINTGDQFNISITYETTSEPETALILFNQMFIPGGTSLPSWWRQVNVSPWAPEDNVDETGNIEALPSIDWIQQNLSNWYGVGIAPMGNGNLLIHSSQGWSHGHYFWAMDGDSVTLSYGPFSFSEAGNYQFEIGPSGWYYSQDQGLTSMLEPVFFNIKALNPITAIVDIKPDFINLKSSGKYVTAFIELPENYSVNDIDISTIKLQNTLSPIIQHVNIGDYDMDGTLDLKVRFNRSQVVSILTSQQSNNLVITGKIANYNFEGSDEVNISKLKVSQKKTH